MHRGQLQLCVDARTDWQIHVTDDVAESLPIVTQNMLAIIVHGTLAKHHRHGALSMFLLAGIGKGMIFTSRSHTVRRPSVLYDRGVF